ncbi:hypothetical protein PoMZ_13004 [Pyricularia oryzae]|uniref:Uncharacterized protein n=1 Tax=Pyricularia oryzae TaxID=318829 RepID=A0A4P7NVR4_PYROR|nr:hypothetical protein PoMZ_13004 [Pyricularia oryzae]
MALFTGSVSGSAVWLKKPSTTPSLNPFTITCNATAISSTLLPIAPMASCVAETGTMPSLDTSPVVGRKLHSPFALAGLLKLLTVSVPVASTANPAATAAPDPPELPPGVRRRSYGLRTWPASEDADIPSSASSCILALPRTTAPALRRAATVGESTRGRLRARARQPAAVLMPAASKLSLSRTGMQNSGRPVTLPAANWASRASAALRQAGSRAVIALMIGLKACIREMCADMMVRHVVWPENRASWREDIDADRTSRCFSSPKAVAVMVWARSRRPVLKATMGWKRTAVFRSRMVTGTP